ncbi:tRNA(m5U54)methyltransferase [Scheffersomyces stipitis CBS 6054]|uniref:tRNA (uracil(54)-C(5))-methyltransferase n=1 Tax=Scheffersomyces stipitis (strain ATCC 58785 / CBS 6054 / NBRC 10063 / NRRL Y-11545) TaxID=322104 RepID=A3GFI1_PICST|nr:tRNA(m5U54)methyltransferase [Scheffersomyces stipitis CBS 6054]EAZ63350.1 tRNA(m5U54)methyltransferase [Scheffersomyces stipitis CBS 6054]
MSATEEKKRPITPPIEEGENKKQHTGGKEQQKKQPKVHRRKYKAKDIDQTSPMGVLQFEIDAILNEHNLVKDDVSNNMSLILNDESAQQKYHRVVSDVKIELLTSNGEGLALIPHPDESKKNQVCIVPFGLPGDIVTVKVFKSHPLYVESDLVSVETEASVRDNSLINCSYFGKCSGCQYQNVEYEQQLKFKRETIVNAYKFFAPVLNNNNRLPEIRDTEPSPLKYRYRTKLTPHFNVPYKKNFVLETRPNLGFGSKGRPTWRKDVEIPDGSILDIEECTIGTPIINIGMKNERARFEQEFKKYKKGATILLREDTNVVNNGEDFELKEASTDVEGKISSVEVNIEGENKKLVKTCVTKSRQIVTEYVNGYTFEFSAGEFFQNNNSILPAVTNYVKSNLAIPNSKEGEPNYLVDAYCGSGLFSITCSDNVSKVIGVEVSADSVKFAERNAKNNNIENALFLVGKAEQIFGSIDTPSNRTSVILDPPRKGCDEVFLNQLSDYHPAKIVYISCNVHSQARDVEWFINNTENGKDYYVESIKGFDFFPQTHHVESVAVLALKN